MRIHRSILTPALILSALFTSLPALAQYSIDKIAITGGAPYTDSEVLAVSGLQPGQFLAHDSLAQAAQHLLDTGVFDDTQISLSGQGKARTVLIALKPTPLAKLLPATFANFVWLTPEEIATGLRAGVPLYRGLCSDAGTFCDSIDAGLTQLLAAKGITATVSHAIVEPTSSRPTRRVVFRVKSPAVRFAVVTLTGGPAALMPDLQRLAARLTASAYTSDAVDSLLTPLRDAGYLALKLDDVRIAPAPSPGGIAVSYSAHIAEGPVYKVSTFSSDVPPPDRTVADARAAKYAAALRARGMGSVQPPAAPTTMRPGDIASAKVLQTIMAGIVYDLRSKGCLDAYVDPNPNLDDAAHTVAYALHTAPGDQYRLKSVTPLNLSPAALDEFNRSWLMKPGDIYNADYVANFIGDNDSLKQLSTYTAGFQVSADPQTHLVDLTLTFFPSAATH